MSRFLLALLLVFAMALPGLAQEDRVWIQIAARSSQEDALRLIRDRGQSLNGLQGMRMGTGWFAVVLGPYTPAIAQSELDRLKAQGRIPADSFIARRSDFRRQFWPTGLGQSTLRRNAPLAVRQSGPLTIPPPEPVETEGTITEAPLPEAATLTMAAPATEPPPIDHPILDETPAEARASEAALPEASRKDLQRALAWFGFYSSAIDGDIGPGTRRAMADWQSDQDFAPSGILTTQQRGLLLAAFRADLATLGLERVESTEAGIAVDLPQGVVTYEGTDAPFVRYKGEGDLPARVVLISETGDSGRLAALADVLQTLDIVPEGSEAQVRKTSFTINGKTERTATHIEAALYDDTIKGFALVWPADAPGDVARIAEAMSATFEAIPGAVLPETAGNLADQDVDLMAGLEIRRPMWTRSGIFVASDGKAVTLSDGLEGCGRVMLGNDVPATVSSLPGPAGLALVTPLTPASAPGVAGFRDGPARIGSEVALAAFPHGGRMGAPSTAIGTLGDIRSPGGDASGLRLDLRAPLGDTGGPVLDENGALIGMVAPRGENGVTPPDGVERGIATGTITASLDAAGIPWTPASAAAPLPREYLARAAADMTALVACWQ